jgi:hypothetical protein
MINYIYIGLKIINQGKFIELAFTKFVSQTHDPPRTRGEEFNNSTTDAVYRLFNVLYF